jgi:DNA-directed RNA polymerase subunit RPC12/RpoP
MQTAQLYLSQCIRLVIRMIRRAAPWTVQLSTKPKTYVFTCRKCSKKTPINLVSHVDGSWVACSHCGRVHIVKEKEKS